MAGAEETSSAELKLAETSALNENSLRQRN